MRISEMLYAMSHWLESPDNEALLLAEHDDECLKVVATSCVEAATALRVAAEKLDDGLGDATSSPIYDWRVWHKILETEENPEGSSNKIAHFEDTYDNAMPILKDIVKNVFAEEKPQLSGGFGQDGGRLLYSIPGQSVDVYADIKSLITPESVKGLADLATALDSSDDPALKKQASVIDELLLTISANHNSLAEKKANDDSRLEELKKKYQNPKKELDELNKVSDSIKAIDKSNMTKEYKILEAPLSTRYCPDHAGAQISRIGEHLWQCELDKKTYNFETGFQLENGDKVPGGDVANQTQGVSVPTHSIFDSREGRLGTNQP